MAITIKKDIIITTPIGTKLNIQKDMVIDNPFHSEYYDYLYEELTIKDYLSWLTGEDRKNYIKLEEQQNPVQFKKFRTENPKLFE